MTLFTIAWHTGEHYYFVSPKLPGFKTIKVKDVEEGFKVANSEFNRFLRLLCFRKREEV